MKDIVEKEWINFKLKMKWKMKRNGKVSFEKGEKLCLIKIIENKKMDDVVKKIKGLREDKKIKEK